MLSEIIRTVAMIRLFEEAPKRNAGRFWVAAKAVVVDLTGTTGCLALAFSYFALAMATEGGPASPEVSALLWIIAFAVVMLGALLAATARHFPWPVVFLVLLLFGLGYGSLGCRDCFLAGCEFGGMTSAVFLVGALAGREIKRWVRTRSACALRKV